MRINAERQTVIKKDIYRGCRKDKCRQTDSNSKDMSRLPKEQTDRQ